jgi:hypothetical protein
MPEKHRQLGLAIAALATLVSIIVKRINDLFGDEKGDEVLAAVGSVVATTLRASDFAGRGMEGKSSSFSCRIPIGTAQALSLKSMAGDRRH